MPALLLLSGPSAGSSYELAGELTLGRSPSCEIPLEDGKVSRRHARIVIREGQARICDLGSRNGTSVNGEKIDGDAVLLPGDRIQVGDSTILFAAQPRAAIREGEVEALAPLALETALPSAGVEAALFRAGLAMVAATSEAMVLRRAAEALRLALDASRAAALLGGSDGLLTAAIVGAEAVEVPRALVDACLGHREAVRAGKAVGAPLAVSGNAPFGLLYAERAAPFPEDALKVIAALGRLGGEALAAVRSRRESEPSSLLGTSRAFRKLIEQARRAAAESGPVVLHGEPGTGKASIARFIHARSARALGPLVEVDCLNPAAEHELFGRPSAPGSPPVFSALLRADGGTLVLRHLDALAPPLAERLAGFLTRRLAPAHQGREEPVDVRLIATSPSPLSALKKADLDPALAGALAGSEIEVLPLRERRNDLPVLLEAFAARVTRPLRLEPPKLSPDALRLLSDYGWPGNVRELRLVAEHLASLYPGRDLPSHRLPADIRDGSAAPKTLHDKVAQLERELIAEALREARGKKIRAAAILGISRPTLDKKIADYQLTIEKGRKP